MNELINLLCKLKDYSRKNQNLGISQIYTPKDKHANGSKEASMHDKLKTFLVEGIENNSSLVKDNYVFVAVRGYTTDGHKYIEDAIESGAICIIVQTDYLSYAKACSCKCTRPLYIVSCSNTRVALAILLKYFYNDPSSKLKLIGITGTNGKTTISYMLKGILEAAKERVGLIGTIANYIENQKIGTNITTPDSVYLNKTLARMVEQGITYCVMEVSSHALVQDRVFGLNFNLVILTNITEDHFDFHGSMEEYYKAKKLIFNLLEQSNKQDKLAIIHNELKQRNDIIKHLKSLKLPYLTYGFSENSSYSPLDIVCSFDESKFSLKHNTSKINIKLSLSGRFNILNSTAAFICASFFSISSELVASGLSWINVPGRFEIIKADSGAYIIIDYAHTDDALRNVLKAIRELTENRIICVFGCGGNRDRQKRALMGQVAARYSDMSIITSDNPRKEDPETIIENIVEGFKQEHCPNYIKITNRFDAIKKAIHEAKTGEVILIAGKGHEDYQILKNKTIHFSDREKALQLACKKENVHQK